MRFPALLLSILIRMSVSASVAVRDSPSTSVSSGLAGPSDAFWMQAITHQGKSPFNNDSTYSVFRNVKDAEFGAKGDGITDDTAAIKCVASVLYTSSKHFYQSRDFRWKPLRPQLIHVGLLPGWYTSLAGTTYLVSEPIVACYYTQLIGDPKNPPTLLAAANFTGMAVIDADPYIPDGNGTQFYINQNNFFRSVRNFIIDVRRMPPASTGTGIHWQVAQATSLSNIQFFMSDAPDTAHQGIWMENGSGGYMGDLVFTGGKFGMWVGSQQFTVRNVTVHNAKIAVQGVWGWGWTFQGIAIHNCSIGFDLLGGQQAETILDAMVFDTPIFLRAERPKNGSLVLNNIHLTNVTTAVGIQNSTDVLPGPGEGKHMMIDTWVQGSVYTGANPQGTDTQGNISTAQRPEALLTPSGKMFGRTQPQYADFSVDQFVSVRDHGAVGDGKTDDTAALQDILDKYACTHIIFIDAGTYIVKSTLTIPVGSRIVGEAWSTIAGAGTAFGDMNNPQVVVRVGTPGSHGAVEISDVIFSTIGPAPGAIVVEWNVHGSEQGAAATWNTHIRLGGVAGSNLETAQCGAKSNPNPENCFSAFMALHLTTHSSAYLEGMWVWNADHPLDEEDESTQLTLFSGRGILSESQGPVWLIGTASEHHVLYQYYLFNARDHYIGLMQTETPYFQPLVGAAPLPAPFTSMSKYHDPEFPPLMTQAWGALIRQSCTISIFGANLYSFFSNYNQTCLDTRSCQTHILDIDSESTQIEIYHLATVSSVFQLSVNGTGIILDKDNNNGFASVVSRWMSI
ncbi:hypothetical protein MKEN_01056500 [Mycena kentingensis (nom. inval.)]|nr:hypothetical protein MKEN_01056500 [Mycena kentingensis (nom. inval.)]